MSKLLLFLTFMVVYCTQACAKETIVWLTADRHSLNNLGKEGYFSIATDTDNLLLKALPQYQIEVQQVPLERIMRFIDSNESYCKSNWGKNKLRVEQSLFSLPMKTYPGLKLYWIANNERIVFTGLNEITQAIALPTIFDFVPNGVLGVTGGRSYGEYLDKHIGTFAQRNVFVRYGEYHFSLLVKMFSKNKFDFIIEFPNNMKRVFSTFEQPKQLKSLPIDGIESFHLGYIACSKTAKNRRYIADVNTALKRLYLTDEFYQAHARHISDADLPEFRKNFNSIFDLNNKMGF